MLAGVAKVLMTTRPTRTSVLESLEECRKLGDEAFLEKYASGLIHEDKRYPMKAVWAAAHRSRGEVHQFPVRETNPFCAGKISARKRPRPAV